MKSSELHIVIGCADARDFSQIQKEALEEKHAEFLAKGIIIDLEFLRVAGSFVTADIIADVKRAIEAFQKETALPNAPSEYYIHIQTHGQLEESSNRTYCSHVHDVKIKEGSHLNCGMLHATNVAVEIEELLLEEKPLIHTPHDTFKIEHDRDIVRLMRDVYGHHGYLAGDWLKSISSLRTHPREQKAILQKAIELDPDLKCLDIQITAGIMDYSIHAMVRLDEGDPSVPFWDEMQELTRLKAEDASTLLKSQSEKQNPLAGLFSMSDPQRSSKAHAAAYYYNLKGINTEGEYKPNTIFHLAGGGFDLPHSHFGPYTIGGFFYAVKHLKLTEWMVMGFDESQTNRIIAKLQNDPIINIIIKKFNVEIIPVNQQDLIPS